ncbi:helix-turn-helix domain-containing protein [Nonomuraea sp. NPDC000554]|uniref:TetR/AcrR family transcriptional regulator n=1 Tax=Nonomuraea sp. NPDC000554 TaxID=3154259 RepID=UPI003324218D
MDTVKRPDKRAERSRQTRAKIVTAAHELFVEHGYGATSLQDVADRAGVAVQTIYFVFRNKRTLLKELVDTAIAGDDEPVATVDRPWFRAACAAETAPDQLRRHVQGTRQILDRFASIARVVETAATMDPEIAAMWPNEEDPRFTVHSAAARALVTKPGARPGLSAEMAADLLYGLLSPGLYLTFVRDRGWSPATWESWAHDTLRRQLCDDLDEADLAPGPRDAG